MQQMLCRRSLDRSLGRVSRIVASIGLIIGYMLITPFAQAWAQAPSAASVKAEIGRAHV